MNRPIKSICFVLLLFIVSGCATEGENSRTQKGSLFGGLGGAAVGGLIGSQSGKAGQGALIGGLVGALGGGLTGNYMDKQAAELEKVAETKRTQDGILVTMREKILFDTGKSDLKSESKASIAKISDILKKYPKTDITVAGYTDNSGTADFNQKLSERRAAAVKFFMVDSGVKGDRITATGFGLDNPVASNSTSEGRSQNRRVELHIVPNDELISESQKEQK